MKDWSLQLSESQAWLAFVQASLFPQRKSKNTLKLVVLKCTFKCSFLSITPEPNMLKILPIIPSSTSQKNYPLFFFILMSLPIIPKFSNKMDVSYKN